MHSTGAGMSKSNWTLVASLVSEDGTTRMDSPALPVDFAAKDPFSWTGSAMAPVLTMDGFYAVNEELTLAFRLKSVGTPTIERLALGKSGAKLDTVTFAKAKVKVTLPASAIVYGATGSPRQDKTVSEDRRRHSVYGSEGHGIDVVHQRVENLQLEGDGFRVQLSHVAARYHDAASGRELGRLLITKLQLDWCGADVSKALVPFRGSFKSLISIDHANTRTEQGTTARDSSSDYSPRGVETYLGRAQEISTTKDAERTYRWLSRDADLENGVYRDQNAPRLSLCLPPAGQQLADEQDLQLIHKKSARVADTATPRALQRAATMHNPNYVEDSDAHCNACKRLPLSMQQKETLTISMYNFKLGPPFGPLKWQLVLKWSDFTAAISTEQPVAATTTRSKKRLSLLSPRSGKTVTKPAPVLHVLKRPLATGMVLRVGFYVGVVEKTISVQDVGLRVENFEQTLVKG